MRVSRVTPATQKRLTAAAVRQERAELLRSLPPDAAALLHSQAAEGSTWLRVPRRREYVLDDAVWTVCMRRRLLYLDPGRQQGRPCAHRPRHGGPCGCRGAQAYGSHAVCCPHGPGFVRRHHRCRDALAAWYKEFLGAEGVLTEQHVPRWDVANPDGTTETAILGVVLPAVGVAAGTLHVGVSIVEPTTTDAAALRLRA